ncbi:putative flagellar motor protein [Bartonella clarridgeiae 73]|uniref:Putative flagellar motor protein n=1 Tax=Bartonella clarridgeiae (strain CCUG 45776 / CIP 104772 / 73) TaxID=696125 RepID=E6YH23_BARC7|nr:chemotaxis protein [Bartonella clarridgeiae]CBI76161.1 putative flagellar motor protein [Bartonella clarridgeiae 73]
MQQGRASLQKTETEFQEVFVTQLDHKIKEPSMLSEVVISEPIQFVRSLQNLQDKIISGQEEVLQEQLQLLEEIGDKFLTFDSDVWKDDNNLYALLIYLFNGGNPRVVQIILEKYGKGVISQNIMDCALAYASHKRAAFVKAYTQLTEEDVRSIPPALFASVVLSTVVNIIEKDPILALKQLDQIRLFAPGTLFEEGAIRRELKVASILGETDLLALLVRHYAHRFWKSPYAHDFWHEFTPAILQIDEKLSVEQLETLVSYAPTKVQFITYMEVSRAALIDARMEKAQLSAQKALTLAHEIDVDDTSARLYYAMSLAGSITAQESIQMLQNITYKDLSKKDRFLFTAAQAVAKRVISSPLGDQKEKKAQVTLQPQSQGELKLILELEKDAKQQNTISPIEAEMNQFIQNTREKINEIDQLLGYKNDNKR